MPMPLELVLNIASFSVSNHVLIRIVQQNRQIYVGTRVALAHFGMTPTYFQRQQLFIFSMFSGWHIASVTLIHAGATLGVVRNHVLMRIVQQNRQSSGGTRVALAHFGMAPTHFQRQRFFIFSTFCRVDGTLRLSL